jgi:hypothetical protein
VSQPSCTDATKVEKLEHGFPDSGAKEAIPAPQVQLGQPKHNRARLISDYCPWKTLCGGGQDHYLAGHLLIMSTRGVQGG